MPVLVPGIELIDGEDERIPVTTPVEDRVVGVAPGELVLLSGVEVRLKPELIEPKLEVRVTKSVPSLDVVVCRVDAVSVFDRFDVLINGDEDNVMPTVLTLAVAVANGVVNDHVLNHEVLGVKSISSLS